MDLLTQAILGATTAQAVSRPHETRIAVITGALAGLLPDADALIHSNTDPLLVLEYHRHFTHSLVFIPFGAAIIAAVVWQFSRNKTGFSRIYLYALLGIALSGILDACTSYGTHLLWPFSDMRISWNLIAIIDPVFTLLLLLPLIVAYRRRQAIPARLALILAASYMMFAIIQHERATAVAEGVITSRGHAADRLLVKPTMANLLLWRSVYITNGTIHADAIRVGLFAGQRIYEGESVPLFIPETLSSIPPDSRAAQDLKRFAILSDGWLAPDPTRPGLIGDARYAMLPNSTIPLWGILLDHNTVDQPLEFTTNRVANKEIQQNFLNMLIGK